MDVIILVATFRRILIVEDNPDDEALLLRQLKKAEFDKHVKVIRDGKKAVEYLTDENFKCEDITTVFLDLNLPKIHGVEILEKIRSVERLRDLTVIVLTSSNSPEELERCRELGVAAYVAKPLTLSTFAKAFADTYRARREATETTRLTMEVE